MADVFVSYSRRDKDFIVRLNDALAEKKRDVWIDWEDIPASADWWREIQTGIESADNFVFVISPDSIRSDVCRRELEYAVSNNKRFIPLLFRPITETEDQKRIHPIINSHNWIFFRETDSFDKAFQTLIATLDTDLSNVRQHTRVLVRAKEWSENNRNPSFLLQGDDLKNAESWLAQAVGKKPAPTPLHAEYITASRQASLQRQRQILAGVVVALVISLALAVLSLLLFNDANQQRQIALVNFNTATVAQGLAEFNAGTATVAQGQAEFSAATATFAQGDAENQRATAQSNAAAANAARQLAQVRAREALEAQQTAEAQATVAAQERDVAQSVSFAGQAQFELDGPRPERAVQLAFFGLRTRYTWEAERALALAIQENFQRFPLAGIQGSVTALDWAPLPNIDLLVTSEDSGLTRIWDIDGTQLASWNSHNGAVRAARWSPDGTRIATAGEDSTVKIWLVNLTDDQPMPTLEWSLSGQNAPVLDVAWSPDGTRLVSASEDSTAIIWDTATGQAVTTLVGHQDGLNSIAWSPDGTRLLTTSDDNTAIVWDAAQGQSLFVLNAHRSAVNQAVWSPDDRWIATGSDDNSAILWDAQTGQLLFNLPGHIRRISRLAFAPEESVLPRLATGSADGTVKIWNAVTGELIRTLFGHRASVTDLGWSAGGARLITASQDGTARVWFTETGGELLTFGDPENPYTISWLAWSPDGQHFATAGENGRAQIWQVWRNAANLLSIARRCCLSEAMLSDEENLQFNLPTATLAPSPSPVPATCPDVTLISRLYPGARGRVTFSESDPSPVRVRSNPGLSNPLVGQVAPGQTFLVLNGPQCVEGIAWFEVIYGISGLQGWLAEGRDGIYYVELVP